MKPTAHLTTSFAVSATIYLSTRSIVFSVVSFFTGFLIDVDHLIDFIREYGLKSTPQKFFIVFHESRFAKLLLLFHAWEWLLVLCALALVFNGNMIILGLFTGMLHHLILDQCANGVTPLGYSLLYRTVNRFSTSKIVSENALQRKRSVHSL